MSVKTKRFVSSLPTNWRASRDFSITMRVKRVVSRAIGLLRGWIKSSPVCFAR